MTVLVFAQSYQETIYSFEESPMFENLLAPLDGSPLAECVLPHLVSMATAYGSQVTILQVLECPNLTGNSHVDPLQWEICKSEAEAYLESVKTRLVENGVENISIVLLEGHPAPQIVEYIQSNSVDLIILSSHGKAGLSRWNVSSMTRKITQRAHQSVLIVRAYLATELESPQEIYYRRLMVPLDGSKRAECALPAALMLARHHEAKVLVTQVVKRPEVPRQVPLDEEEHRLVERITEKNKEVGRKYLEQLQARLPDTIEPYLRVSDDIAAALHVVAEEAAVDLVVLCAHGYSGKRKWPFGSITNSFIEYGSVPLLMVQDLAPEEVEPTMAEEATKQSKGH